MGFHSHLRVLADLVGGRAHRPAPQVNPPAVIAREAILTQPICEHAFVIDGRFIKCWRCGHREVHRP